MPCYNYDVGKCLASIEEIDAFCLIAMHGKSQSNQNKTLFSFPSRIVFMEGWQKKYNLWRHSGLGSSCVNQEMIFFWGVHVSIREKNFRIIESWSWKDIRGHPVWPVQESSDYPRQMAFQSFLDFANQVFHKKFFTRKKQQQ